MKWLGFALAVGLLSGCFTMLAHDKYERVSHGEMDGKFENAMDWGQPFPSPRHVVLAAVCRGKQPAYRLEFADKPLYLVLRQEPRPEAVITDTLPGCTDPALASSKLDLVVTHTPMPFRPTDSGDTSRALMVLDLNQSAPWSLNDVSLGKSSYLLCSQNGEIDRRPIRILLPATKIQSLRRARWGAAMKVALAVPLDVVTSPVQLVVAIVALPFLVPVVLAMMGGVH